MRGERTLGRNSSGEPSSRRCEWEIARLARRQARLITRAQLLGLGLTENQIEHRLATLRLVGVYRGVYQLGSGSLEQEAAWLAATLFAGPDSLLSHFASAAHWGLRRWVGGPIDVTAPRRVRAPAGVRAHRSLVPADQRRRRQGIPLTSPARTILDCAAAGSDANELRRMINAAHPLGLPVREPLRRLVDRHAPRRGIAAVRASLAAFDRPRRVRSELEYAFLDFLDRHGLPLPLTNQLVDTNIGLVEVDCLWRERRVVIELDAYSTHGDGDSFHRDRRRDRALRAAGWNPSRVTDDDLDDEAALARDLVALLAA